MFGAVLRESLTKMDTFVRFEPADLPPSVAALARSEEQGED